MAINELEFETQHSVYRIEAFINHISSCMSKGKKYVIKSKIQGQR